MSLKSGERARGGNSGSKLPHSKAPQRMPPVMRSPALPALGAYGGCPYEAYRVRFFFRPGTMRVSWEAQAARRYERL